MIQGADVATSGSDDVIWVHTILGYPSAVWGMGTSAWVGSYLLSHDNVTGKY